MALLEQPAGKKIAVGILLNTSEDQACVRLRSPLLLFRK